MSTTTEREIKVADGLGNADASQVLYGATFSSESGFNQEGAFVPDASNITYNDGTVADALDDLVENGGGAATKGTELTDVLPSGQTTIVFTNEKITDDSKLNAVYTSIFDVQLESASFENGSLTLVFPSQEEDMTVVALINATSTSDDIIAREVSDELNAHIEDTDNPHNVTAEQVSIDGSVSGLNASNVQGALDELGNAVGHTSKNLIPYPFYQTSGTYYGMVWTDKGDGTISADGTCTVSSEDSTRFNLHMRTLDPMSLKKGTYKLTGCPQGGSASTYSVAVAKSDEDGNADWFVEDYGEGVTFTLDEDCDTIGIQIRIMPNVAVSNLVFKPMIRLASIEDDTYELYSERILTRVDNIDSELAYTVLPKRASFNLSSAGWYRIAKMECGSLAEANGAASNSCDIEIKRMYNTLSTEYKRIKLASIYNSSSFVDEISKNYNGDTNTITKIRQTVDTANNTTYIEVYYKATGSNQVRVVLSNHMNAIGHSWELITPETTSETASGVNVLGSREFALNCYTLTSNIEIIQSKFNDKTPATNKQYYNYTATRKCLVNASFILGSYNSHPTKAYIYKGQELISSFANSTSSITLSCNILLNAGEVLMFQGTYASEAINIVSVNGYVQYLE